MSTYSPKPGEIAGQWHVIDATGLILGRLASKIAVILQGKHKPTYSPHVDTGDFVIVGPAPQTVRDGEIVVALVNGSETTLKRFYSEPDGRVRLQPANSAMPPILVSRESLEIQGRVRAVLRKYR